MSELKPCPFCPDGEARVRDYKDVEFLIHNADCFMVQCDNCGCGTSYESTREKAVAAWNRRTNHWIPVSERLPEPGERVLVYCQGMVGEAYMTTSGKFNRHGADISEFLRGVTCWRTMPAPPEGVKRDDKV